MDGLFKTLGIKNILITNYYMDIYGGSQLVVFDLARLFKQAGCDVTVAGFVVGEPMVGLFKSIGVDILNPLDDPQNVFNRNYDLIWGHHWPVLGFVLFELEVKVKYLVLGSLSPFEPVEAIWMLMEESSLIWFNSVENYNLQMALHPNGNLPHKSHVLCNSLMDEWFSECKAETAKSLRKIAVISNHVPKAIKEAIEILRTKDIGVSIFGVEYKQELITPGIIDGFDAVITIGHSVQKSLARGVPVYCYDRFGGPGWIIDTNIERSEKFNFSGRCCNRKLSASALADEIVNGFEAAAEKLFTCWAVENYSLAKNISKLLGGVEYISEYKNFSGAGIWKAICQAYVSAKFGEIIPPTSNVVAGKKKLLHISVEMEDLRECNVQSFSFDPIKQVILLWDTDGKYPLDIGGVLFVNRDNCFVEELYGLFQDGRIHGRIGIHSPGLGQNFPKAPFSHSSRFSLTIPNILEARTVWFYAKLSNSDVIKLATLDFRVMD